MLRKAKERFMFGGPDDPCITIDLTDSSIGRKATALKKVIAADSDLFERAQYGELSDEDAKAVAELWRIIIVSLAGKEAYDMAIRWVSDGSDIDPVDCNLILSPLVTWLVTLMNDMLNVNAKAANVRYLRNASDAI